MQVSNFREEPGVQILFVDDEVKTRKYFKKALSLHFYVQTCKSVVEAQQILKKNPFIGILITDQRMPEKKGTDLLKYAKQNHPHIVRILTTAYVNAEDALSAINESNVFRYITKPWNLTHLTETLGQAMEVFLYQRQPSLFNAPATQEPEQLMLELQKACHRWLLNAYHSCDTVEGYLWGLDAILCVYSEYIDQHFDLKQAFELCKKVEGYILSLRTPEHIDTFKESTEHGFFEGVKH